MESSNKNGKRVASATENKLAKVSRSGVKHLVQCRCVLPQYKSALTPVYHQFVVFSVIDETDSVISKIVQCNNCGILHRIFEVGKSEILSGKEELKSLEVFFDLGLVESDFVAHKVDVVGTQHQQLRHDCIVVVVFRQMAFGTGLGFRTPLGMGIVRIKCL